jgi:hypothetical protein
MAANPDQPRPTPFTQWAATEPLALIVGMPGARYRTRRLLCDSDKRFAVDFRDQITAHSTEAVL